MTAAYWWTAASEDEPYWMEITDRPDLGADLKAPQTDESGSSFWSYSLVNAVREGDIVFHYHKPDQGIVARSRAVGRVEERDIIWAAHGTSARESQTRPHARPGWRIALEGFTLLPTPVSLAQLRAAEEPLKAIRDALERAHGQPLYFPFAFSDKREIRTVQGYLVKLPSAVVRQLGLTSGALGAVAKVGTSPSTGPHLPHAPAQAPTAKPEQETEADLSAKLAAIDKLDLPREARSRAEQPLLRKWMMKGRDSLLCAICGRELPVDLLVAAHIKRRSECSEVERRDFSSNLMPACKLGCDDLFERGYIVVGANGKVSEGFRKATTAAVQNTVTYLRGKTCSHWTPASEPYFAWHRQKLKSLEEATDEG
jgi:hypothetical protein